MLSSISTNGLDRKSKYVIIIKYSRLGVSARHKTSCYDTLMDTLPASMPQHRVNNANYFLLIPNTVQNLFFEKLFLSP